MNVSTQELADALQVSPQRIAALAKFCKVDLALETYVNGRNRFYRPAAVKKILEHRGVNYSQQRWLTFNNQKGGVGKTSVSTETAKRLAALGFKVLFVDVDPQANATSYLLKGRPIKNVLYNLIQKDKKIADCLIEADEGLTVLPSSLLNGRIDFYLGQNPVDYPSFMRDLLSSVDANFVIFDTAPSISRANVIALMAADWVIVPSTLTQFSVDGAQMTMDVISENQANFRKSKWNPDVKIVINGMDNRVSSQFQFGSSLSEMGSHYPNLRFEVFNSIIRADNSINRAQAQEKDLSQSANFYRDIVKLTDEMLGIERLAKDAPAVDQIGREATM